MSTVEEEKKNNEPKISYKTTYSSNKPQSIRSYKIQQDIQNVNYIPITQIEIDSSMQMTLDKYKKDYNPISEYNDKIINRSSKPTRVLNRMSSILNAIKSDKVLPIVELKMHRNFPKYVIPQKRDKLNKERDISYEVINGRHRIVASILFNKTHIPANVCILT